MAKVKRVAVTITVLVPVGGKIIAVYGETKDGMPHQLEIKR